MPDILRIALERQAGGVIPIENHSNDSRVDISTDGKVQTLTGRMGTGGGNVPLLMDPRAFGIGSYESGGMLSDNPNVGYYEAKTSRTIDTSGGDPTRHQGGMAIVAKMAKGTGGPAGDECQNLVAVDYVVRRLTPLECCRLQGFPDGWTDLQAEDPDKVEIRFWMDAWLEHWAVADRARGIKRPKDEKAVRRWLTKEPSESDQYKLWGNSLALPNAYFVFQGIKEILDGSAV